MGRIGFLAIVLLSCSVCAGAADLAGRASIIDGDTLEIHGQRIRLFGIDAPATLASWCRTRPQAAIARAKRMRGRGKSLRYIVGKLALDGHRLNAESVRRMLARS